MSRRASAKVALKSLLVASSVSMAVCVVGPRAASAGSSAGSGAGSTSFRVPSSIPDDCSSDTGTALSSWLATLPSKATVVFPREGCYLLDESVQVTGRDGLLFEGDDATLEMPEGVDQAELQLTDDSDITVKDLDIVSDNTAHAYSASDAFQAGIELAGGDDITLSDLTMTDVYGDFVTLDPFWPRGEDVGTPDPATDVTITDDDLDGSGRMGIGLVSCDDVAIKKDQLDNVALDVFDLEASYPDTGSADVVIEDDTTGTAGGIWLANAGNGFDTTGGITVAGNTMTTKDAGDAVLVQPPTGATSGPWTIEDNTLYAGDSAYVAAFELYDCVPCEVTQNTVYFPAGSTEPLFGGSGSELTEKDNNAVFLGAKRS